MSADYFYFAERKRASSRSGTPPRTDLRGELATGRIARILFGQGGHGFIRLRDDREVFFHRSDLFKGTAFNDLQIGDVVTFEVFDDPVSGARALRVKRTKGRTSE